MTHDSDYFYPETPEELGACIGMMYDASKYRDAWTPPDGGLFCIDEMEHFCEDDESDDAIRFRFPLPTLADLKVGDVVKWQKQLVSIKDEADLEGFKKMFALHSEHESYLLLLTRNTWIPIKGAK